MHYRRLTPDDEQYLWVALLNAIYVEPGMPRPDASVLAEPAISLYVQDWMQREGDCGFLAETGAGHPIGAAWLRRWSPGVTGFGFVDYETPELSMSVDADQRGLGVGTNLLRMLLSYARTRYGSVCLSVASGNRAIHLYEREGFLALEGPGGDSQTMVLHF